MIEFEKNIDHAVLEHCLFLPYNFLSKQIVIAY